MSDVTIQDATDPDDLATFLDAEAGDCAKRAGDYSRATNLSRAGDYIRATNLSAAAAWLRHLEEKAESTVPRDVVEELVAALDRSEGVHQCQWTGRPHDVAVYYTQSEWDNIQSLKATLSTNSGEKV